MFVTSDDYLSQVSRVIAEGEEVSIAVAFLGEGAERLFEGITKPVRLLCNLMSGATNPDVVEHLCANPMVQVRHVDNLHAKVIHNPTEALIGSANLSANGLNLEGVEGTGWREAGYVVRDAEQLTAIRNWFDQQWGDCQTRDVADADLIEARRRWELRRAGRVVSTSRTARLIDVPIEQLKGLPIYLVLYNGFATERSMEVGDERIEAVRATGRDELADKLNYFEQWPELPKEAALICFRYGSRLGLRDERVCMRIDRLDISYHADGEKCEIEMVVVQDHVRDWAYSRADARELANVLKPAMKRFVSLAGEHGSIVLPLHQALAMARGHE